MKVSHEVDSNVKISPKMSYGVLECDIGLHAYDSVIKKGCYLCQTLYIQGFKSMIHSII